jgi:hypothetical protein
VKLRPFGLVALAVVALAGLLVAGAWPRSVTTQVVPDRLEALVIGRAVWLIALAVAALIAPSMLSLRSKRIALKYAPWRSTPLVPRLERPG